VIYPTRRAILMTAAGAPVALVVGLLAPGWWVAAAAWVLAAAGLMLIDAWMAPSQGRLALDFIAPTGLGVGREGQARVDARFAGAGPARLELALETNDRIRARSDRVAFDIVDGHGEGRFQLTPLRRGEALFERLWARWRGPLGLVWVQRAETLDRAVPVTPDVQSVKDQALRLLDRNALFGVKAQLETGEGTDFHALKDFQTGMDLRAIDWKQSARHGKLVGKEFRTERNHHVILALDTGRLMCAPLGGAPRIDRAINAALLLAFISLKLGDRVGLFAFDSKPRVASGATAGAAAFPLLQRLAASLDYSTEETNFTLGLSTLSGRLDRRSLVVVFTDFADPTSAEMMIENLGRLLRTHLVLFVVFRDEELESLVHREPADADDVSRAVIAGEMLRQRDIVIERLRRMGALIVDARADRMGVELVNAYLDAKRRDLV
jgi:uncharacterized protein (DUF58 family)